MKNVLEWLEASARRCPDAVSFADADHELSFSQLERQARGVGTWMAAHTRKQHPVAFYLEKSTKAICGMLGAVYARCAYSVLDVRQPNERARSILNTLEATLVVTDERCIDKAREVCEPLGYEPVLIEELLDGPADDALLASFRAESLDTDLLYVSFTSGSTGTPKGVAVCHRSVIDFITAFTTVFDIREGERLANQAPFDFDGSVKDIYSGLRAGAAVHMIPREYFSVPVQLMDFLADREITSCNWAVSAMCFVSIMNGFEYRVPESIRRVNFTGEVMPPKHLAKWRSFLPDAAYANLYGPTEITCNCTYYKVERTFEKGEVIPAGKAFDNERVFLLDEHDALVSEPQVPGEICVSGTTLALGYYNAPEKTAEVFVQNPLNTAYPERIYRTGDIGYYDENGDIVYQTRKDNQIKHLGQRIELGEIEAAAHELDAVSRACCIYDARKKKILLFFTGNIEKGELNELLAQKLPQYMVPNKSFPLEQMPLNKNGKIDRDELKRIGRVK